jgi:hypothetical protein
MARCTTVSVILSDGANAVLVVDGRVDAEAVRQVEGLLAAAVGAGARHVIVDLSGAREVPEDLLDGLLAASWGLTARGGWLLVEGAEETDPAAGLLDAFRAYREVAPA